jgi:hypothetical protein
LSVVAITPSTDPAWLHSLALLRNRAAGPAVILLDQASFGGPHSANGLANHLAGAGLVVHVVSKGQQFRTISIDKREWEQQRRGVASQAAVARAS